MLVAPGNLCDYNALMCFTPRISLATAIIEFLTALYLWLTLKRTVVLKLLVIFLYLLGMYQFSEFMICKTDYLEFWSRVGFISYNFLPAVGLHIVLKYSKLWCPKFLIYLVPAAASVLAVWMGGFISEVACHDFFVTIKTPFFKDVGFGDHMWFEIYSIYYFGFLLLGCLILMKRYFEESKSSRKSVFLGMLMATLVSLLPAYIFVVVLPAHSVKFPSIYCQFAILFAVFAIYAARKHPDFVE